MWLLKQQERRLPDFKNVYAHFSKYGQTKTFSITHQSGDFMSKAYSLYVRIKMSWYVVMLVIIWLKMFKIDILVIVAKATSVRGITLTAAHLGSILNFAMQPSWAKFKKEPKCAAVKVTPLTEVALRRNCLNLLTQKIEDWDNILCKISTMGWDYFCSSILFLIW